MQAWGIGEVLWDIFPDGEQFGGAALNFCSNLQRLGDTATLLSAVGADARGESALERMHALGLTTGGVRVIEDLPTGTAVVGIAANHEASFVIPRPAAFDRVAIAPAMLEQVKAGTVDWLYFGTLLQTEPVVEAMTTIVAKSSKHTHCFYDMNLRTGHWNLALVERLSGLATILKLNDVEARLLFEQTGGKAGEFTIARFCATWAERHGINVICCTLGPAGCFVYDHGIGLAVEGFAIEVMDTVGAGDAFAAAFLHGYSRGWTIADAARFANALGAIVASRAGATPQWTLAEVLTLARTAASTDLS